MSEQDDSEQPLSEEASADEERFGGLFSDELGETEEDVPEWLRSLRDESESDQGVTATAAIEEGSEPIPFWLDFEEGKAEESPSEAPPSEKVLPFHEMPFEGLDLEDESLLSEITAEAKPISAEEPQTVPPFETLEPFLLEEQPSFPPQEQGVPPQPSASTLQERASLSPEAAEDWMSEIPSWLDALPGQDWEEGETAAPETPPEFLEGIIPPFVETEEELSDIEFPAWLGQIESTLEPQLESLMDTLTPAETETLLQEESLGEISQEQPAQSLAQEEIPVEVVGPLHGLRGILPAEPLVAEQKKPSKALSELLVTDKQRAQAELFLKLIEEEGKPKPMPSPKRARPHILWRMLIFFALFAGAILGFVQPQFATPPQELSVGVFEAMQAVNQLPAQASVLLVVDIEGQDFAEMQATTAAMLDQMMIKGAFFVLVSANQSGALQADRLLREVSRLSGHQYQPSSGWVNLGYLPGGVAGMQAFSQSLTEVLPFTIDGEVAWQNDRLRNIRTLSDFDLVVVITEDSTRARQWVEQLKGHVLESRLLFAVSAQVEPLIRSYYEANPRQIQSVLAGIRDGAIYETQTARPGWAMKLWGAYTLVVLTAIALILVGSVFYAVLALLNRPQAQGEGKER